LEGVGAGESQVSQRPQREIEHDPAVINHLLELRGRFLALVRPQVGLPAKVNWVEHPQLKWLRLAQLVGRSGLQDLHRPGGVLRVDLNGGPDRGQPVTLYNRILGKILVQPVGELLRLCRIAGSRQRQRRHASDIFA